jgi:hypothetical protein
MHITPLPASNGSEGEFTIDDLVLFTDTGQLATVHRMWSAITKYSLMVDRTHAQALDGVRGFLAGAKPPTDESALDDLALAHMEEQILSDSDSYLLKSLLFLSLVAFNEFALKEVYKLFSPPERKPPAIGAVKFITEALTRLGVAKDVSTSYNEHFINHIEPVRNGFAHGDWAELGKALTTVDLAQSFLAVAGHFTAMGEPLRAKGLDV